METKRINGYLYMVAVDPSTRLESGIQEEQLSAEEYLASKGIPDNEIRKIIIESE
ncbi:MAG: hypothetical protein WCW04_00395 [Candidatus Paceibacterota bacterium]|nr:hypothetical protein [Candidatus Nomurabacteria bacterium]